MIKLRYACCFCSKEISREGPDVGHLAYTTSFDGPTTRQHMQELFCHATCLRAALHRTVPLYAKDNYEDWKMNPETLKYNEKQEPSHRELCDLIAGQISISLPEAENKIWHAHPVWFLDGNPTVGYSKQKPGIRLMFWSGADFGEAQLNIRGKKFKDASVFLNAVSDLNVSDLRRWLKKSKEIQWDYKNIVKRKGRLEPLK